MIRDWITREAERDELEKAPLGRAAAQLAVPILRRAQRQIAIRLYSLPVGRRKIAVRRDESRAAVRP
jgi:hypothetical protein